jgi:hypothetical protein
VQVRGLSHRFDDFKAPAMLQRRDACARIGDFRGIDLSHDDTGLDSTFSDDAPPGVNDQ